MRLRGAVLKRSLGRDVLYHLDSTYQVEVNGAAHAAIETALANPEASGPGRGLVERLAARGLVEDAPFAPIPRREHSDLVHLEVEPMGRCNLACRHCFVKFSHAEMREVVFDAVLEGARALGAVELTLNGGEPLLHPRAVAWLRMAHQAGLRTQLFTNGTLVDDTLARSLVSARVARVTVSLDGFEASHDALRGKGAFGRAVAGIRALVAAGAAVHTTTVVHPGNTAEVEALRRYCLEDLRVRGVRLSTVAPMGRARSAPELQLPAPEFKAFYSAERRGAPSTTAACAGTLDCRAGTNKLFISAPGRVYGCHLFEAAAPPLGDLSREPLADVYASVGRRPGDEPLRAFSTARLSRCGGCPALDECQGGCRARAWQLSGDMWGPDPVACQKRGVTPPALAQH